ncbi:MAG: SNF2-related protein [Candidatus Sericytochromatia bacterium]
MYTPRQLQIWFGMPTYVRATSCVSRIRELLVVEEASDLVILEGQVQGTARRPYDVSADWDGETFESSCSCPVGFNCKHGVALLLAYLERAPKPAPASLRWQEAVRALAAGQVPNAPPAPLTIRLKTERVEGAARDHLLVSLWVGETLVHDLGGPGDSAGIKVLLDALRPHLGGPLRMGGWRMVPEDHVHDLLSILATSNRVMDHLSQPLTILPWGRWEAKMAYVREGEGARLLPSAGKAPVVGFPRSWAWTPGGLMPLLAPASGPVAIPPEERSEFERRYLPDLAVAGKLVGEGIPEAPVVKRGKPKPQLVLEEKQGKLHGRLGFLYGGVRIEAEDPARHVGPPEGPYYSRAGTSERKALEKMPLKRKERWESRPVPLPSFDFEGDVALDFLLEELPALLSAGFEVLGEDALANFRVTRSAATTSFSVRSGVDWLGLEGGVSVDGEEAPWPALWEAIAAKRRYVRLGSGRYAKLPTAWLEAQKPLLSALGIDWERLGAKGGVKLPRYQGPAVAALLGAADHAKGDQAWKDFSEKLRSFGGIETAPLPEGFTGELRPYQRQGYDFLAFLRDYELHGVLADDMGLGKTVQAAALLLANHQPQGAPSLVVAPTSLLLNWQSELARFAPALKTHVLHGPGRDFQAIEGADVVITTYTTARLDLEAHAKRKYHTLILDEAQAIKNPKSQTAQAMRALSARHRLCLTGTPIENNLLELWSLFHFLMPGMLGTEADFKSRYAGPVAMGDRSASAALKTRVSPFMLRRLKSDVALDLPPRTDIPVWCELAPAQRRLYETVLAASRARVMAAVEEKGTDRSRITILDALLKLRQVCCHPALLKLPETLHLPSSKLETLLALVDELREGGHRALLFSQFTTMLDHIREKLDAKGIAYEYLDGKTRDRQARVERFNRGDAPLFLISLKAGGTGLNLTGADYVIHYDPWWNPAVEDQATDRAHRIGQTRHVFNYKLLAKDTVEEKLLALQEQKRALVKDVLTADGLGKALTIEDLRFLFGG